MQVSGVNTAVPLLEILSSLFVQQFSIAGQKDYLKFIKGELKT